MSHRRVYAKLQAEINEATKNGVAPASPSIISDADVRRLPYLGAVVREALRVQYESPMYKLQVGYTLTSYTII
jgi:hypothetical protein